MKISKTKEIFKTTFFIIVLTIHFAYCNEFWIGADAGVDLTKFTDYDWDLYKAKMKPGFLGGISFIHKPFNILSIRYRVGYNQLRPALIDDEGVEETEWDPDLGIIKTGKVLYNHRKYSLSTLGGYIQPSFNFFIPQKRLGASIGLGIGIIYRLRVNYYAENFGTPIEKTSIDNYNKVDFPIVGSIGILFRIKETIILSLNNNLHLGMQKFDEEKPAGSNYFEYPSFNMAGYQGTISISYRFYKSKKKGN